MKSLREYITESEQWIDSPSPGDDFAINIREDVLLETYILEADDDRIVLASDDELVTVLEEYGMLDELEGMAEEREDREWSKRELEALNKAGRDFERHLASVSTPDDRAFNANLVKKRMAKHPLAGPKGQLPEQQGVAEGSQDNMDDKQSPDQHLSRIRELAGMAEASPDWRSKMGFDMDDPSGDTLDDPEDRELHRPETFVTSQGNKYTYVLGGDLYDPSPTGDEMSAQIRFKGIDHVHPIQRIHLQYDPNMQAFDPEESRADDPILDIWLKQQRPFGNDEDSLDDFVDRAVAHVLRPPGLSEAEYRGRKVPLGKPMRGDVKKRKVYVRKPNGNVVKVEFGDKTMRIKKSNPKRRKSFRARHNCANPGPRWKARYWSCRAW